MLEIVRCLDVTVDHAAFLEVTLVVLLGLPEGFGGLYFGGDGQAVGAGGV